MADDWYETVYENEHDVVNEFIRKKQSTGCSHRTLNSYSRTLKKFFHEQFPDLTPSEVTVRHVEDYVVTLDQRGLSQNTKRRYLESLSAFYDWTMKRPRFEDPTDGYVGYLNPVWVLWNLGIGCGILGLYEHLVERRPRWSAVGAGIAGVGVTLSIIGVIIGGLGPLLDSGAAN